MKTEIGSKRFTWTKRRKNLRAMLTHPEKPMTVEELKAWMKSLRMEAAKEQGWRSSELACTIVGDHQEIDEVARRCKLT